MKSLSTRAEYPATANAPSAQVQRATPRIDRKFLCIALCVSAILQAIHLVFFSRNPSFQFPFIDEQEYVKTAQQVLNVLKHGFVPGAPYYHSPFYPWFLATVFSMFGVDMLAPRILQIVMSLLTTGLVFALGNRMFPDRPAAAKLATIFWILYGPVLFYTIELANVVMILLFAVLGLVTLLRAWKTQKPRAWAAAGLMYGLYGITRPDVLPFVGIITMLMLLRSMKAQQFRSGIRNLALFVAIFAIPFIITGMVNVHNCGKFVILPANSGLNFHIGNNPDYQNTIAIRPGSNWETLTEMSAQKDQFSDNAHYYKKAFSYIGQEPQKYMANTWYKIRTLVNGYELPETFDMYMYREYSPVLSVLLWMLGPFGFPFGILMPIAVLGIWLSRPKLKEDNLWWPLLFVGVMVSSLLVFWNSARYRMPLIPVLAVFAAYAVLHFRDALTQKKYKDFAVTAGSVILMTVAFNVPYPHFSKTFNFKAELLASVGMGEYESGKISNAITSLEESLSLEDSFQVRANLAWLLEKNRDTDRALREYEKAIAMNPTAERPRINYGVLCTRLKRYTEALTQYNAVIAANPANAEAYYNRGNTYYHMDRYSDAADDYKRTVSLRPMHGDAWFNRGLTLDQLKQTDAAIIAYRQATEYKKSADAFNKLGVLYAHSGKYDEAVRAFTSAVNLNPDSRELRSNLALALKLQSEALKK
jgi:tetratricopeptide (TPR) repeat protein